jgi:predicted dithiol-disulfide oxidoreductase (DUF899 family)
MKPNKVVSQDEWVEARKALLAEEKAFTRARDALSAKRRELPWVRVDKDYRFEGRDGAVSLADLFDGHDQLVVYHFMFDPDWEIGCKSCSFWADNFNGITEHLARRDVAFAAISRAPCAKLAAFRERMGWTFPWVSSHGSDFNRDFDVTFSPEELARGKVYYNFRETTFPATEAPGISVFAKGEDGAIYRTYSTYGRGLDMMNTAYHYLDLVPKGRDEDGLPYPMAWVELRETASG